MSAAWHRPASLAEAAALAGSGGDVAYLAGGHTLIPAMKSRLRAPDALVDLSGIGSLAGIAREGEHLWMGAMTRHAEAAESAEVRAAIPALARLAGGIGDPQVRNRGTLGGSLANNDPAADYPAAVVALAATVITNKRKLTGDQFFTGMYETALQAGEIIISISFPVPKRAGYMKFKNPASRYAMVGVFIADTASGIRVAVTGAGPGVFRSADMEKALAKSFSPDAAGAVKVSANGLNADIHASAEYRAHLVTVMAKRAVEQALSK